MNAPSHPYQQSSFPGPGQPPPPPPPLHPQNGGQAHQAQGQHPSVNGPQQKGNQSAPYPYDPKLSYWTLRKGNKKSWEEVEPVQARFSYESLEQELSRIHKEGLNIHSIMRDIPSDNARSKLDKLVVDQNVDLSKKNPRLEWVIAGIELDKQSINRKYTQLKQITVILKTEARAPLPGAGVKVNSKTQFDFPDPLRMDKSSGMGNPNHGQGQAPKTNVNHGINQAQNPQLNQQQVRGQIQAQMGQPPPPPPPPPPTMGAQGGPQGVAAKPPPPPPPPPPGAPIPMAQMPLPNQFPEPRNQPSMRHEPPRFPPEVLPPHVLMKQKAKARNLPGHFPSEPDSGSDTESDLHSAGSGSFSAISIDEDGYDMIAGRQKGPSHANNKTRSHSRVSTHRAPLQGNREKFSRGRAGSIIDRPPMGKHSNHSSPRSSSGSIKQAKLQEIHAHLKNSPEPSRGRDYEHDRERGSGRPHSYDQSRKKYTERAPKYDGIRDNDRDRHHDYDRIIPNRDQRHSSRDLSPSTIPRDPYNKLNKFSSAPIMSRNSSTSSSRHSGTTTYDEDTSSVVSSTESVFSKMGEETSHRARRRYDDHHYDDYPRQSHSRSHHHHHHHGHRCNQYPEPVHGAEEMFVDGDGSVVTVIRQPSCMPRRHSTQVHQYVSDQPRFPPPRSHTYSEAIPDASHYYATQKALPYGNGDLEDVATTAAMKAVEAMAHQQALQQQEAMEHIHHAQVRPLGRQNTIGSRRRESGHDLWANKGYPTRTGADRSGRRGSLWG